MKKSIVYMLAAAAFMMAGSLQAAVYEFTSGEGFTNGPIAGQVGWIGGEDSIVNTNDGGFVVFNSTNQWQSSAAGDALPPTNNVFSVSGTFSFSEAVTNGGNECFSVQVDGDDGSFRADLMRVRKTSGDFISTFYAIRIVDPLDNGYGFTTFADTALGVDNSADYDSDDVVLSLTIERGAETNDWDYAVAISNATTAAEVKSFSGVGAVSSAAFYNSTNFFGAFNTARNEAETGLSNRQISRFEVAATYVTPPPTPGPTLVQWGEAAGDVNIVSSLQYLIDRFNGGMKTTYEDGYEANPEIGTNYYANATNRSPVFNHAASVGFDVQQINNDGNGDFINSGKNLGSYRKMVTWENFLIDSHTIGYLATSTKKFDQAGTDSSFRWILRKDTGEWYASDEIATSASWEIYEEYYPETIDWYAFDPYQDLDDVTFAASASSITMANVDVVGLFTSFENNSGFCALHTRYFKASAPAVVLEGFDAFVDKYELTGGESGDDDTDGETNWEEYVLGGNPTNSAVQGILPSLDGPAGDYIFSIRADDMLQYYVLTNMDLAFGSWGTNYAGVIGVNDGEMDVYTNNVGTANDQLFIKLLVD